ncbi:MAG TPA: hypothetical protein VFE62_18840 [Gemmataceae bacterium]|nr:hypothetical protein [Gemmataceae bacterium]
MKRAILAGAGVLSIWLGCVSASDAQVFIRAPFVRVWVGGDGGVGVRAPFVNLNVPGDYPPPMYGPRVYYMPPPGVAPQNFVAPQPQPAPQQQPQPVPIPDPNNAPPPAIQPAQPPTLEALSKTFQPKAGSYEMNVINPVTKQPTTVRFRLPEGTPRRIIVTRDSIEWVYGLRQWVRIEFDKDGAIITSR